MGLSIIGLGLFDEKDITVRGLDEIRKADYVFLESYTSILSVDVRTLEQFLNKKIEVAHRDFVEQHISSVLERAVTHNVSCLVVGDPFCATTHADLFIRARQRGVDVKVVHNASIMSAVGACGLQVYRFGETVSIPFFDGVWKPTSFYDKILANRNRDLHTLCLLDIKVKEQSVENMMKGNNIYDPPRYMSVQQAISQILFAEEEKTTSVVLCYIFRRNTQVSGVGPRENRSRRPKNRIRHFKGTVRY